MAQPLGSAGQLKDLVSIGCLAKRGQRNGAPFGVALTYDKEREKFGAESQLFVYRARRLPRGQGETTKRPFVKDGFRFSVSQIEKSR